MGAAEMTEGIEKHLAHHVLSGRRGTVEQQAERGKAARKALPRTAHALLDLPADRRDPVEVLQEQAASRVQELLPIRYGRMASSPFAFYRGAAAIMAADLASTPSSGIRAQLCGDAHLMNFGVYNSPDRRLVFDLNDFDETLPGPWEWDLKRLAASLVIAGQENGYSEPEVAEIVRDSVRSYRTAMADFAGQGNLAVWYSRLEVDSLLDAFRTQMSAAQLKEFNRRTAKFASRDSLQAFGKLTRQTDDGPRFRSEPPLVVPVDELFDIEWSSVVETADRFLGHYLRSLPDDKRDLVLQYRFVDLARKVVGVGSVGTRAWIALLLGHDGDDPLILQWKEAQTSVLEPHLGSSPFESHGRRVVAGQQLMQASTDIFLGWYHGHGLDGEPRDFYVRQLRDGKGSVDVATMAPSGMRVYGEVCAWTLARAHARSGDRVAIASYVGTSRKLDDALTEFGHRYAEQNRADHAALVAAIADGRVEALSGV
ncbi:MAG: DUF2252 domain-containing protein [Candidatus Nanopelagicales bacterium]